RKDLQSQIDDLWLSLDIIMDFEIPTLSSATEITGSDHKILTTSWKTMLKKWGNAKAKKWQKRRKVYKYDKMEEEDWLNFGRHIETELQKYKERFESIRYGKELDNS
ncbi:14726_t:CDS:1, partial [Gigaspora rosea]